MTVFPECFQMKYSRNLLGSKYDWTMVTFNSCTDTPQISAAPDSRRYLILLVPFWKMKSFVTKRLRFLVQNRSFLPRSRAPAKVMRYADETFYHSMTARYELHNDLTFSLNINTDFTRIPTSKVLTLLICNSG